MTQPDHVFRNHGCPKRSGRLPLSNTIIDERLNKSISRISDFKDGYRGNINKIKFKCNICFYEWYGKPNDYINKDPCGCPKCARVALLTNDEVDSRLPSNIKRVDNYINGSTEINFRCEDCGNIFSTKPHNIFHSKTGCPICKINKWEKLIYDKLMSSNIKFIKNYKVIINKRRFFIDFFLPDLRIAIEYNGEQHYKPIKIFGGCNALVKQKKRDIIIKKYCKKESINLITYSYRYTYHTLSQKLDSFIKEIKLLH